LKRIISNFIWKDDSSSRITSKMLKRPITKGGLNLLDIEAQNNAIDIIWLKTYLNFSPKRPEWATVTDLIIEASAPHGLVRKVLINPFLQR
jgi:hypothetical protein